MKCAATFVIFFICYSVSFSQKEMSIWYFGNGAGLDFRNNTIAALTDGALNTIEGCATISDSSGNLLFYTDGVNVWNKEHNVMPNGHSLHGHASATQSAIIVRQPGDSVIYYVFTVDHEGSSERYGIQYSVVDVTLDNNLGDVTTKNVPLFSPSSEKVMAVRHQNNRDVWVVTHDWGNTIFRTYLLTDAGVSSQPVLSQVGRSVSGSRLNAIGYLKASHDGSRLVFLMYATSTIQLFDFDIYAGRVSNAISLQDDEYDNLYGAEFSPDNNLLYISRFSLPNCLYQFNLNAGDTNEIKNSRVVIDNSLPSYGIGALQLGPDKKIYASVYGSQYVGVVNNPNGRGTACRFRKQGIFLDSAIGQSGLPTFLRYRFYPDSTLRRVSGYTNSRICEGGTIRLTSDSIENGSYQWRGPKGFRSDEQNPVIPNATYDMSGKYFLTATTDDRKGYDTVVVVVNRNPVVDAGPDINIVIGFVAKLNCEVITGEPKYRYSWEPTDGLNDPNIADPVAEIEKNMTYIVTVVDDNGCVGRDTVNIIIFDKPIADAGDDIEICSGQTVQLNCVATKGIPPYNYSWKPEYGLSDPKIADPLADIIDDINYIVTVTDSEGYTARDTVEIKAVRLPVIDIIALEEICEGGRVVIGANADGRGYELSYSWSPSDGLDNDTIAIPEASPDETTTYIVTVTNSFGCRIRDTVIVRINEKPIANAGPDQYSCTGDTVRIGEIATGGTAPYIYKWTKTQFTDLSSYNIATPVARKAGEYIVEVTDVNGCVDSDTMAVDFSPNLNPELGKPRFACNGEEIVLSLENNYYKYLWHDGSSAATFKTISSDTCWVRVEDENGCIGYDTVIVTIYPNPVLDIGADIYVCEGEPAILTAPDYFEEYLWHNGSTETSIIVNQSDTCWLRVADENGCIAYDTLFVGTYPNPVVSLGEDQQLCEGVRVELDAGGGFRDYNWNGEAGNKTLIVDESGQYQVEVTSFDGCAGYDTVQVTFKPKLADVVNVWLENGDKYIPNDNIKIKLMASFEGLVGPGKLMSFESTISYNRTALDINSVGPGVFREEQNGKLNLLILSSNAIPEAGSIVLLAEINGKILLPDRSANELKIEEFTWEYYNSICDSLSKQNSEFYIEACGLEINQIKSFEPTQMNFNPNPALNNTTFEINSEEQGDFTLTLYSTEGYAQFATNWHSNAKAMAKEINVDLSNFSSGIYQVVLKSPWNIISGRLSIIK